MPVFQKGGGTRTPFGKNAYLRSTKGVKKESYTLAAASVPSTTIDGFANQKVLQPGTVLAKITVGADAGKVGPYQAAGTNNVQTITPSGTWTGGTYTLTFNGQVTAAIPYNATNTAIKAALEALSGVGVGNTTVSGGPLSSGAVIVTFVGQREGVNPAITLQNASLTGTSPNASVAQTTAGVAGATDGRQTLANIVGINDTFLPWQLIERDVEVAVAYNCVAVQAWCFEMDINGNFIALQDATANSMYNVKGLDVHFK